MHVDTLPIEDGHTAAPVVGTVGSYVLGFREVPDDEPDALARTYRVRAEPLDTKPPSRGKDWSGRVRDDPPMWRIQLRGDGWSARWLAPRPAVGHLELRGTITGDWSYGVPTLTRGRITRARVVTETYERTGAGLRDWRRVPSAQQLRELAAGPLRFDHGLVPGPRGSHGVGRAMVAPDPWIQETGVLVDLDLDDVPPYALRPAIVPGGLAAHGRDLWIADVRLPVLLHLRDGVVVDDITWRGVILTAEQALHQGRTLHADAGGCWITGTDGVHRADHGGTVRTIREESASQTAATTDGTLAVWLVLDRHNLHSPRTLVLIEPDGTSREIAAEDSTGSFTAEGDGFIMATTKPEPHLVRIHRDGHLTPGPTRDDDPARPVGFLRGDGPLVRDGGHLHRVLPDLTLDAGTPLRLPGRSRHWWARAGRVWALGDLPYQEGNDGWWPLDGPPPTLDGRYQLLVELDPDTGELVTSTIVPAGLSHLCVDGDGTVWVSAHGLWRCRPGNGAIAERIDVAAQVNHRCSSGVHLD